MKKLVIFNVGGAFSAYGDFGGRKIMVDLGRSADFSPVEDFLIPLAQHGKFTRGFSDYNRNKWVFDQLFLSHLDNDHIGDYQKFREYFHPHYMTCPNDNHQQNDEFKVKRDLLGPQNEIRDLVLQDMRARTTLNTPNPELSPANPLVSILEEISLFYINPDDCEVDPILARGYANNISLVLFFQVRLKTLLIAGDLLKDGMKHLLETDEAFHEKISSHGVDFLVAPHHGLQTSFSEDLFAAMPNGKSRLNIISEKVRRQDSDENRSDVDGRYYSSDYSTGDTSIHQNGVKTSLGHIVIDFETDETEVRTYQDIDEVINEFL